MAENRQQEIYQINLNLLLEHEVPEDLAKSVASIVAKDDGGQVNLGRTEGETETVKQVLPYLNKNNG